MITAQNKSIENLTLTGSYYFAPDMLALGDTDVLWGEAAYKGSGFSAAIQGGEITPDNVSSTSAFGAKIGGKLSMFSLMAAYSSVGSGTVGITNLGTLVKSPLYTQMVLNNVGQYHAAPGSEFVKVGGSVKGLGGTWKAFYGAGTNDDNLLKGDYTEFDFMYVAKITENIKFFGAYVYTDDDGIASTGPSENNFIRFWARYNFK